MDLFSSLQDEELRRMASRGRERRLDRDKVLRPAREPGGPGFFVLLEGAALASWAHPSGTGGGHEVMVGALEPGDFVGHLELFGEGAGESSVRASSDARWMLWSRETLLQALQTWPGLAVGLLEGMARQQARLHRRLAGVCNQRAPRRLARTLAGLIEDRGIRLKDEDGRRRLLLPDAPPRRTLGEMAGMARETVSRILTQWEQCGWITETQGDLVVRDEAQLRRLEGD
jgi:CRP-like cAMP-binding protein